MSHYPLTLMFKVAYEKITGFVYTKPSHFFPLGCRVRSNDETYAKVAEKPSEILLTHLHAIEKKLSEKMVIRYAK